MLNTNFYVFLITRIKNKRETIFGAHFFLLSIENNDNGRRKAGAPSTLC